MSDETFVVVGLGNPGPDYAGNRHNIGQMALAELAERGGARFRTHKGVAAVAEMRTAPGGPRLILTKSLSYMNTSGGPVASVLGYYGVDAAHTIVVHDDLDLPFDSLRLKLGGGHGGHNGLRDIIARLGTPDFMRVRMGIGRPPGRMDPADFVLRNFTSDERKTLPVFLADAADAVELIATDSLAAAQLKYHTHPSPKE